jgi:hypothetical protein
MNRIYRILKYILCILVIHVIFKGEVTCVKLCYCD